MEKTSNDQSAFLLLILVVFLWGLNSVSIKYLTHFFPPLALAPIRLTLASALLLPIVFYQYGYQKIPKRALLPITGIAVFCIFLHQIALTIGIGATSGIHAVLILGLSPLFTTSFSVFLLHESFTLAKGLGIALGFSGLLFVVAGQAQTGASLVGDGITCIATITFVIGSLFVKKATYYVSPLVVTAYSHVMAAIGLDVLGLVTNSVWLYPDHLGFWPIAVLLFSSLMSTAVGALLWNMSIQKVGASTASFFQNATPLIGIFASALFLGEELHWQHFYALILVMIGVSLGTGVFKMSAPSWSKSRS
ncbi:DMT family transporter [Sporomusa sp. KB1]|jgi:drug/metabolite transporter (DMT)-like permease|uniref:DMT family transporter n=1 Tax=Sporomusa sp. KB1 TaxID=943346 RepID=UPI0011A47B4A|nr:DMT family transporter [Sporomusa sp. KB1]TWH52035.1 EamA-like transporter family protein [Sporomusa sp. KB1]